jgi:Cu2+-exporting ATPase
MDLATNAMALIHQNWTLTAAANILAFVLAIPAGAVAPAAIAALSNGSAIVAAMNAARPLWG